MASWLEPALEDKVTSEWHKPENWMAQAYLFLTALLGALLYLDLR